MPLGKMEKSYATTRFVASEDVIWPIEFAIVSARSPTGERWTEAENERADLALWRLLDNGRWLKRIICISSTPPVKEPCWAFEMPFQDACDVGVTFRQEALFWIRGDELFVSYCDHRRELRALGRFRQRLDRY